MATDARAGAANTARPVVTRVDTTADITVGMAYLADICPRLRAIMPGLQPPLLRRREGGFAGLVGIVIAQQLSVASAKAIQAKVEAAFPGLAPELFAAADDAAMRAAGLSGPKIRTLRSAAQAAVEGRIDFAHLADQPIEAIHQHLTAPARHRAVDGRHLRHVLPRPWRCFRAR